MDPVSGSRGRGRGRGRKETESSERDCSDTQSVASTSSSVYRNVTDTDSLKSGGGRGRGGSKRSVVLEPFVASSDPSPVTLPDNPDEDDFLSAFRRFQLHSNGNGVSKGRGRGIEKSFPFNGCPSSEPDDSGIASLVPGSVPPLSLYGRSVAGASNVSDVGNENYSDLEKATVIKRGDKGKIVPIVANFLRMNVSKERGLFEYHVSFEPEVESIRFKKRMINSLSRNLGRAKMFDGAKLYLSTKLPNEISEYSTAHPNDANQLVSVKIMFVKKNNLTQCVHFYNVLFRRIMEDLGMIEMKRHFYNHRAVFDIPQHKLEIWPGFVTAIDEYEGGLMLCCDSSFRVLRTSTVLDIWYNFQCDINKFKDYILGKIVLTRYNNKHYRVDDVLFKENPCTAFKNSKGMEITYVNYYRKAYGITIRDLTQPLLVNLPKANIQKGGGIPQINLIPELCYVTGLDSTITSNYEIMKDVAAYTRLTPHKRKEALHQFIKNVNNCLEAKEKLNIWGLTLEDAGVKLQGRVLTIPQIQVNQNNAFHPTSSNFGDKVLHNQVYEPVPVRNWLLLYSRMDRERAHRMVDTYRQVARPFGIAFSFSEGQAINVGNGTVTDYSKALDNNLGPQIQFVVIIVAHARDDLYAMVKQKCTVVRPIPSQVILSKTLGNEKRLRSIMQKIAMQINCKLGGSLWSIRIPLKEKIMFMGFDVYHDPRRRNKSVTAIVSSLNDIHTKYYSRVIFQDSAQEVVSSLTPIIVDTLQAYSRENSCFPDRVIVWRDGVSDGQLSFTKEHEVVQLSKAFKFMDFNPKFTFCVVQKRINARLLLQERGEHFANPEPGTVVDHTVTRKHFYDFFLVSQLVREGTVSPTHYIVLEDNADINPDLIQKFAFATTFMYFNWTGSVRVPAMCQYAHKLASLVGQYVQREPSIELSKSLYYL